MNLDRPHRAVVAIAVTCTFFSAAALAGFGETAAQVWAARSNAIAAAVNKPILPGENQGQTEDNALDYIAGIKESCSGLTGEIIKNGGKNTPVWAQTAQQKFCLGASDLMRAYKDGHGEKDYCKDLRSAIGYATKAKRGEDPDIVVDASEALVGAANRLLSIPIKVTKKSFLGDSQRSFSCG